MDAIILINKSGGTASGDDRIGAKVEAALRLAGIAGTVEFHRARIMSRFDARSLVDLVRKVADDARAALSDRDV